MSWRTKVLEDAGFPRESQEILGNHDGSKFSMCSGKCTQWAEGFTKNMGSKQTDIRAYQVVGFTTPLKSWMGLIFKL